MVDKISSTRGWRDWLVQRITAVLMAVYTIFILLYILTAQPFSYDTWHYLFAHFTMKLFSFIVLLSMLWHAWIGLWTVLTDYVKNKSLRVLLEILICLLLLVYLVWIFEILW